MARPALARRRRPLRRRIWRFTTWRRWPKWSVTALRPARLDAGETPAHTQPTPGQRGAAMKPHRVVLVVSLGLVVGLAIAPITVLAGPGAGTGSSGHGGGGGMMGGGRPGGPVSSGSSGLQRGPGIPLRTPGFFCCGGFNQSWFPYYARPYYAPYYAPPAYYASTYPSDTGYGGPPAYAPPPPPPSGPPMGGSISIAPTPQAAPDVIEYPNGRHELRGDGVTTPYRWVWVPYPPPPPPPQTAPPTAPPSATESSPAREPSRPVAVYRWTDEDGGVHWTDRLENVPARHRQQAKQTPPI